jgi:arachidonate 15-lipoxygenase
MKPVEIATFLATPQRWACLFERVTSGVTDAIVTDTTQPAQLLSRAIGRLSPARSFLLRRSPALRALDWRTRKGFWSLTWSATVALQRWPKRASIPREDRPIYLLSAPSTYPDFRAPSLVVPSDVPCAEKSLVADVAVEVLHLLQDIYPVDASHQPVASSDPETRLLEAYTAVHRAVRPPPVWHGDLVRATKDDNLLGALAVGGPFAKLLESVPGDHERYVIDLRYLSEYPVRDGLCQLGSRIHFIATDGSLRASGIEYGGETITAAEGRWELTQRIALAGLLTHLTVWRQGMEYHVGGLAPVPVATHNLPTDHPLRRLLAPHVSQTLVTNRATHLTLRRSGWDVRALSFPYKTLLRYYDDGARAFDIGRLDVRADAQRRGIPETLSYPYLPQAGRYYELFESYVRAYLEHCYPDDATLQGDTATHLWFEFLDREVANGIGSYVPSLTRESLIRLCTLIMYSVSVGHTENSLRDYAVFLPTNVRGDGVGQSVGEVQLTLNFQLLITSPTTLLLHDFSHLALDADAAEIMRRFQAKLWERQREMEHEPDHYWSLYPSELEASVSA